MIRTARLVLRRFRADDAEVVVAALADGDIARRLARVPSPYTRADADAWLAGAADEPLLFAVTLDGAVIGAVGIGRYEGADGELGYWLARPHWGRGIASEAAAALVAHAEGMGIRTLVATPFRDNPASARVLMKAGFHDTGETLSCYSVARGAAVPASLHRREAGTGD